MPSHDGYIDLQVNGFAGVDFNCDELTGEGLSHACQSLKDDGAAGFLPTVITADLDAMVRRLARIVELREADPLAREMILGVHIEGPFISQIPGYVGAHPPEHVRAANLDEQKRLLEAAGGLAKIVTLAPEHDTDMRLTQYLVEQGITVSAGHCDPSLEQLQAAVDAGVSMFTHLGNGCPAQVHKHDNIVQRTLSLSDQLWISFIADGAHIPLMALGNYLRCRKIERCVIISDAISATGLGPGRYPIGNQTVYVGEDQVPRADEGSHLVGSATSVSQMKEKLRKHLQLSEADIEQLTSVGPRAILQGE
ncbi:MAG: N-acetylglucosamine-6-phosphate deacetylase [Bythopirellula sp.]